MQVFIIESSYPKDFYREQLDGLVARNLLNTIGIKNQLRIVIDKAHFAEAIRDAAAQQFDVLHLSCHGSTTGIALCDNTQPSWAEFVEFFDTMRYAPSALIMSACCGATSRIGHAFKKAEHRPKIIFGSTKPLGYADYCVAWSILYHRLNSSGVTRVAAQTAMRAINAVVQEEFIYRRWDDAGEHYKYFPQDGFRYAIKELSPKKKT